VTLATPRRHPKVPATDLIQAGLPKLNKHRFWNGRMARPLLNDPETRDVGAAIALCSERLLLVAERQEGADPLQKIAGGAFCNRRLCPMCEWRRARAWRARLIGGLERFYADHSTFTPIFLTLTVRNCRLVDLKEQLQELHASFSRMVRLSEWPTPFWFRRTEITLRDLNSIRKGPGDDSPRNFPAPDIKMNISGPDDPTIERLGALGPAGFDCHPHLHVLLLVPRRYFGRAYVKQTRWQQLWQMSARLDYAPTVDVRRATAKEGQTDRHADAVAAAIEAAKYISKASEMHQLGGWLPELHWQLKGLRMIGISKELRAYVKEGEITPQEMLDLPIKAPDGVNVQRAVANWIEGLGEYRLMVPERAHYRRPVPDFAVA
jgi:plasmid rolling circle replication initiator protein Rep